MGGGTRGSLGSPPAPLDLAQGPRLPGKQPEGQALLYTSPGRCLGRVLPATEGAGGDPSPGARKSD